MVSQALLGYLTEFTDVRPNQAVGDCARYANRPKG